MGASGDEERTGTAGGSAKVTRGRPLRMGGGRLEGPATGPEAHGAGAEPGPALAA